jgi:unsaturated pyranuronate lyase
MTADNRPAAIEFEEHSPVPPAARGLPGCHCNWSSVPIEQVAEGIERQMIIGERVMICRFRFKPFLVTPEHEHPHEQVTMVAEGRVRFLVEGKERIAGPGDVLHFPPGCRHGATMMEEEVVLIDIFSPIREDFLGLSEGSR